MLTNTIWISPLGWGIGFALAFGARDDLGRQHWSIVLQVGPFNVLTDFCR